MKHGFLNNTVMQYLCTGITAGILCCISLTLLNYKKSLDRWATELSSITVKTVKMKSEIETMQNTMSTLRGIYPQFGIRSSRESLLAVADDIRQAFKGYVMTLGDITSSGNELVLPITLRMDNISYKNITTYIGYLQTHMMPYVNLGNLSIERTETSPGEDRWTCTLDIFLRIYDDGSTH